MSEVTTQKLIDDIKVLIEDTEGLIKVTAGQVGERGAELRRNLETRIAERKAALTQYAEGLRNQAGQTKKRAVDLWQDEGWRRLAVAVGLGVLVGMVLRCRRPKTTRREE